MPTDPTRQAYWLLKDVNRAIRDYQMIANGDRVAVAVSGGKDSLTTLLNLLYHGKVETMAPRRDFFDGALRLVRPLCYLPEGDVRRFARACPFPPPPPDCPQSNHSRRQAARDLLAQASRGCPSARINLLRAGLKGNLT
jgi:tRNA(Ile)-lysidine synthase TilS/MesJ